MIPSKEQFMKWKLPSKASYVGLVVGVFSAVIGVISLVLAIEVYKNPNVIVTIKDFILPKIDDKAFAHTQQVDAADIKDGKYKVKQSSGFDAPIQHGYFYKTTDNNQIRLVLAGTIVFGYYSFEFEGYEKDGHFEGMLMHTNDRDIPVQPIKIKFFLNERDEIVVVTKLNHPVYREVEMVLEVVS